MNFNVINLKKKLVRTYEATVKKATTKAIPIIKQEATKAIAKSTDEKLDLLFDILGIAVIGTMIVTSNGAVKPVPEVPHSLTYIHVENLTINM